MFTDPDSDPDPGFFDEFVSRIRVQVFDDQECKKMYSWLKCSIKNAKLFYSSPFMKGFKLQEKPLGPHIFAFPPGSGSRFPIVIRRPKWIWIQNTGQCLFLKSGRKFFAFVFFFPWQCSEWGRGRGDKNFLQTTSDLFVAILLSYLPIVFCTKFSAPLNLFRKALTNPSCNLFLVLYLRFSY